MHNNNKVKENFKKGTRSKRIENYENKEQQSKLFAEQELECNLWLSQNLDPRKTASILTMIEQIVETRAWKAARGLIEDGRCRICFSHGEMVEHLIAGCRVLANNEYLTTHNRALIILAVAWAKEYELIREDTVWYKERWERGRVLENGKAKLVWDFEFNLRKTNRSRRPDLILEDKESKKIWICDMACHQQQNIEAKRLEKLTMYTQLAYELREKRPGYKIMVIPLIIGALGGGMKTAMVELSNVLNKNGLQKTILMDSDSTIRKVLSGLIQGENVDEQMDT